MDFFERTTSSDSNRDGKSNKNGSECISSSSLSKSETISTLRSSSSSRSCSSTSSSSSLSSSKKRKRKSTTIDDDSEAESDAPPPAAKRMHRLSYYQSEPSSISSSVYPSPVDDLAIDIGTPDYFWGVVKSESGTGDKKYDTDTPTKSSTSPDDDEVSSLSSLSSSVSCSEQQLQGNRTPHSHKKEKNKKIPFDGYSAEDCMTPAEPEARMCPLPALTWANAADVWNLMYKKDEQAAYYRDSAMLNNHPSLQARMRAILLDWLIEVCEVYKLHRETYYLAVDYLDRYLSKQKEVQKTHLQLIGITCLFVAAKVEEIYPPKIGEFAYVTDGACQETDILQYELLLLEVLDWKISPVTVMAWLGVYMQLNVSNRTPESFLTKKPTSHKVDETSSRNNQHDSKTTHENRKKNRCHTKSTESTIETEKSSDLNGDDAFIYPQFSCLEFVQTTQLIDLCSLDLGIANYPYSVIAAAAMSHTFNKETALRVSGLEWRKIEQCARWMEPFFNVVREETQHLFLLEKNEQVSSKFGLGHICPNIITDDSHVIQTHTTSMAMFDKVNLLLEQTKQAKIKQEASPAVAHICPEGLLTPPASSRKPFDSENIENKPDLKIGKI